MVVTGSMADYHALKYGTIEDYLTKLNNFAKTIVAERKQADKMRRNARKHR